MSRPTEAQEMIEDILHSEGILSTFFSILWYRGSGKRHHQLTGINVPDTVIYLYSKPLHWFFSSKKGEVRKKSRGRLNSKHIEEQLMKHGGSVSGAKGCYLLYPSDDPQGRRKKRNRETLNMKYTFGDDVRKFLQEEKPNGMLQLFFDPKPEAARCGEGIRNATIETTWTPGCFMIEKRVNKHQLDDEKIPIEARASTFAGDNHNWENMPVVSDSVAESFHKICESIAEHIRIVLGYKLAHLVLTFKVDRNDTIWLLYCSSMKVVSEEHPIRSLSADLYNPHVTVKYGDIGRRNSGRVVPKKAQDMSTGKIKCPLCLETLPVLESCNVKVKTILTCLSEFDDESKTIPPPLHFLFPMLTEHGYENLRSNPEFANSPVRICTNCVTTLSRCANGTIPTLRKRPKPTPSHTGTSTTGQDTKSTATFHVPRVHKYIVDNDKLRAGTMTRWPSPEPKESPPQKKPSRQEPLSTLAGVSPMATLDSPSLSPLSTKKRQQETPGASTTAMLSSISPVYFPDGKAPKKGSLYGHDVLPALKKQPDTLELYAYDVKGGLSKLGWATSEANAAGDVPRSPQDGPTSPLQHVEPQPVSFWDGIDTGPSSPVAAKKRSKHAALPHYYHLTAEVLAQRFEAHRDVPPAASTNDLTDSLSIPSPPPTPTRASIHY
eukprot:TRINITY_DN28057_c0_g1_i1.p1 TRINITY_DN28057_c0_g1~~TRINITY_DN28057_c0_g1_i1.p1  ORF type:complete len:662 (+),score=143.58 TRINITY_DN28057_c0_g1_i1:100-2085(+)